MRHILRSRSGTAPRRCALLLSGFMLVSPSGAAAACKFVDLAVGAAHVCGLLEDGSVGCGGYNAHGQTDAPSGAFTQVSAGDGHSCAVRADGSIACWGSNREGQSSPPGGQFVEVSAANVHSCGLRADGSAACWTSNYSGVMTPPRGPFTHVVTGNRWACGLRPNGEADCWGTDPDQQGSPPDGAYVQLSLGARHSCGVLQDATVSCWGSNFNGESSPPSGTFVGVSAGYEYTCGLRTGGTIECWGLGPAAPTGTFLDVSVGRGNGCALQEDGTMLCWGIDEAIVPPDCSVCGNGVPEAAEECDDGNLVANDGCSPDCVPDCLDAPRPDCRTAAQSTVVIKDDVLDGEDTAAWKWKKGAETALEEITDPRGDGRYQLCFYPDDSSPVSQIVLPPLSGWRLLRLGGFEYTDDTATIGGVLQQTIKPGAEGSTSLYLKAKGEELPDDLLPTSSLRIQLVDEQTGICWESVFSQGRLKNGRYKAKSTLP